MASLKVLGAGAAQSVISEMAAACAAEGWSIEAEYGGVHAMAARVAAGEPADVVVLTRDLVDELSEAGALRADTRHDVGSVDTAVAVRAGATLPEVASIEGLKRALLQASHIVFPDAAMATAGRSLLQALDTLAIREAVAGRLVACANGAAAAQRLAAGTAGDVGVMQATEILAHRALALAGPFPASLRRETVYCAAVSARSRKLDVASAFIRRLAGSRSLLRSLGFSPCTPGP